MDEPIASRTKSLDPRVRRRITFPLAVGLACCAPMAAASYAQMTLPGLGALFLFGYVAAYALAVDVVLLCRGYRSRASVVVGTLISLALLTGLLTQRQDVAAGFQLLETDWEAKLLGVAIVLVPLTLLVAPVAQHLELRRQRSRWTAYVAIVVQAVLVGTGWTLAYFDEHPTDSMQAARKELRARGEQVEPGGVAALRDAFERQHAWGTFESFLLLKGIENSALIHSGPPLPPEDRNALIALLERDLAAARPRVAASHHYGFIEIKLLWDTLEPGNVAARLPRGTRLQVEYMLEFIDRHGRQRLCSVDELAAADRAALDGALAVGYTADIIAKATRSLDRLAEACRPPRDGSLP
jgi:hypothetical protein